MASNEISLGWSKGSHSVLGGPGGEIPPRYSTQRPIDHHPNLILGTTTVGRSLLRSINKPWSGPPPNVALTP